MKKILLFSITCFIMKSCPAQLEFRNSNVGRLINFEDFNGHSLLKKYDPSISGSPFINDDWVPATITLSKGKVIGPLLVKINIESNEIYFIDSAGKEMIAVEGLVKKVDCAGYYSKDSIRYVFKNGYPAIDKQNEFYYYQVLTEGTIELLAKKYKYIRTTKDAYTSEVTKDFLGGAVVLYVYANETLQSFHPNKEFVISLLKDKEKAIINFIEGNNINYKKTADLIKLFNYYNGLN